MVIAKAQERDLPAILELQYLAYESEARLIGSREIPPLKQTLDDLEGEFQKAVILKALDEQGNIIGSVRGHSNGDTLKVGKLMVHPDHRGRGLGSRLLAEIETRCPHSRYELFTSTKSRSNIRLYERAGYRPFDERPASEGLSFIYLEKTAPL